MNGPTGGREASNALRLLFPASLRGRYEERIRDRLRGVSYYEQIRKFRLLNRGFMIESGEITPKRSLRRREIAANLRELIEDMYRKDEH